MVAAFADAASTRWSPRWCWALARRPCSAVAALTSLGATTMTAVARNAATAGELLAVAERCGVEVALVSFDDLGSVDAVDVAMSWFPTPPRRWSPTPW